MNKKLKDKWVKALRSGEYQQCQGGLRDGQGYCCMGVLCEVAKFQREGVRGYNLDGEYITGRLENSVLKKVGLSDEQQDKLIGFNDTTSKSFKYIASYINRYI